MRDPLLQAVAGYAARHGLLSPPPRYAAVSGGVDSVVLLHALVALGQRPEVVSCDHGLRPEAADEVRFVEGLAQGLGLPCHVLRLEVGAGPDLASRARAARYAAWDALPAGDIALGHHQDDQAETVLDHLMRGAGAGGLGGMRPRRGRYVRPLLGLRRAELLAWAQARGLRWVEDPSNPRGQRGALRAEVLPRLQALRAGAAAGIARSAELLAQDDALLHELARGLRGPEGLRWEALAQAPAPLRRRAVQALVHDARGGALELSAAQIDAALGLDRPGAAVNLPGGWWLVRDGDVLRCLPPHPQALRGVAGRYGLWGFAAQGEVTLRPPRPGERAQGERLSRWMARARIPAALRPYVPVVERAGRSWIPGRPPPDPAPDGVQVRLWCTPGACWPGGGPFEATI